MFPGEHAATAPDKIAVIHSGTGDYLTYAQLEDASCRLANVFRAHGLGRGDVVAIYSDNTPRIFELYWAAQRSGLYYTPIDYHLSVDEAAYIVRDSDARAVIARASLGTAAALAERVPGAVTLRLAFDGELEGFAQYDLVVATASDERPDDEPRGSEMLYSSGTTGRPKGIKPGLPSRQVYEPGDKTASVFGPRYGFDPSTIYYSPAPLYHTAPLRFAAAAQAFGGTVVTTGKFEAETALQTLEFYRVTHSQWVPTMFVRFLKLPVELREKYDLSAMKVAIHAAAPCPVDVKRAMLDWWGPIIYEYYSSTESNGVTFIGPEEWLQKPGSVGRGGELGTVRICDDAGNELPAHEVGTVYFERRTVPFSYHGDPQKTKAAQNPLHPTWTTTGDLGYLDDDGYLFLTDRKAYMIISGGVNIYPREVEDALSLHPQVADVAVVGRPDPEMGQSVHAYVQLADQVADRPGLDGEIIEYVRQRMAHYKAPRTVQFVSSLPRTETGKLIKRELPKIAPVSGA